MSRLNPKGKPRKLSPRKSSKPKRSKPRTDSKWWDCNQVKNLDALSLRLSSDLRPYLPEPSLVSGDWSPIERHCCAAKQLQSSLLKKYEWDASDSANQAALDKFLVVNNDCKNWALDMSTLTDEDHLMLGELRFSLYKVFNRRPLEPTFSSAEMILQHSKVGPGASLGANGDGLYSKLFSSQLTCTSEGLYSMYRNYIKRFPSWLEAEQFRSETFGRPRIVKGNKMCFVPKNVDISRVICVEPSLNMYFQLGIKQILESIIKRSFSIDFSTQQVKNRDLAQLGSMFDKQWVTIDLSSASDSMSLKMLEHVLPSDVFSSLVAFRSPEMTLPNGDQLELGMISTMGNGFTFPLQTLLFLCVVWSCSRLADIPFERPIGDSLGNFGVFGDDIICRAEIAPQVLRLLGLLGFSINNTKSFLEGPFRESCGGDFFRGHPVRGVYIDSLRSPQDAYIAINKLNLWTSLTGIYLCSTVRFLISLLRSRDFSRNLLFVPLCENDDAGVKTPRSLLKTIMVDYSIQSVLYRRFVCRSLHIRFRDDGTVLHPFGSEDDPSHGLAYNPSGLYVAFLSGNISGIGEGIRQRCPLYRTERRVTPNWDYIDNAASIALADASMQLGTAISGNTGWS